jgi:hypothetical protein
MIDCAVRVRYLSLLLFAPKLSANNKVFELPNSPPNNVNPGVKRNGAVPKINGAESVPYTGLFQVPESLARVGGTLTDDRRSSSIGSGPATPAQPCPRIPARSLRHCAEIFGVLLVRKVHRIKTIQLIVSL